MTACREGLRRRYEAKANGRQRQANGWQVEADERNVDFFLTHGTRYRPTEPDYTCIACGREVSIEGSTSCQGHNLLCNDCFWRLESNYGIDDAFERQSEDELIGAEELE